MILGVYGASGLGREVLELARIINRTNLFWDDFIFIDDADISESVNGYDVYKYEQAKEKYGSNLEVVIGIGEPVIREKIFNKVRGDDISIPSLVHPDIHVPETTSIGEGVVIQYGCFISCNVTIEDNVFIQPQCNIGHDDVLKEGCMLAGFSNIGGIVSIGRYAYVGLSSAIKQTVSIGDYAIVGMGAIVHKDVPDEMIAMGNPARVMARNENKKVFGH